MTESKSTETPQGTFNMRVEEERLKDLGSRIAAAATKHGVDLSKVRNSQVTPDKPASK